MAVASKLGGVILLEQLAHVNPFVMERTLRLFRSGPSAPSLWDALVYETGPGKSLIQGFSITYIPCSSRLSEVEAWNVLLLEAGGEEPLASRIPSFGNNLKLSPLDWQYWTQPQEKACGGQPCQWPRGKVLGGGSAINDMIYNRGNRYDYDTWAELGKCVK